LNEIKSSENS